MQGSKENWRLPLQCLSITWFDVAWLVLMSMIIVDLAVDMELQAASQGALFMVAAELLTRKPNEQNLY